MLVVLENIKEFLPFFLVDGSKNARFKKMQDAKGFAMYVVILK